MDKLEPLHPDRVTTPTDVHAVYCHELLHAYKITNWTSGDFFSFSFFVYFFLCANNSIIGKKAWATNWDMFQPFFFSLFFLVINTIIVKSTYKFEHLWPTIAASPLGKYNVMGTTRPQGGELATPFHSLTSLPLGLTERLDYKNPWPHSTTELHILEDHCCSS